MTILTKGGACSLLLMMLWMGAVHIQPVNAQSTGGAGEPSPEVAKRPNVLLVMTDDQGWGDVYSHGNYKLDTPAMDRLATQGARFNRFYVSPVCAPTRASLMTGRYYLRTGVADVTRGFQTLRANEVTLAEVLGQAGYTTGLFGKWHLGEHYPNVPRGQGFDQFIGFLSGHWNDNYDPALLSSQTSAPGLDTVQTKGYINNVLTDAAIEFMEGHRDEPFLNFVSYNTPHSPYQVPDSYFQKYQERGYEGKTAAVYGMVDNLDDNLGRLLNALERLELKRETIVLFLTDNGPNGYRFNGGMRGKKGKVHEGGVRVPLFMRWPGQISPSQTIRKRAAHIDLLPTLADLTGVELTDTKPLNGRSLVPLLEGALPESSSSGKGAVPWTERTLYTHRGYARDGIELFPGAVRTDRYRLVCEESPCQLYDMIEDPVQEENIAQERPALTKRLREDFEAWYKDVTQSGIERPFIPVGYEAAPIVDLPAPEAYSTDGLEYAYEGYAHEWLTGWSSQVDSVWWELDVIRPGRYAVEPAYTTSEGVSEVPVRVEAEDHTVEGVLQPAGPHEPSVRQERDPEAHRPVKEFPRQRIGTIRLEEGEQRLTIKLSESIPQGSIDLQLVVLRRLE